MGNLNARGETIVEVLMVLLILGSALTSAFVITGRATSSSQLSLERTEANGYAQTQLERIKAKLASPDPGDVANMNLNFPAFCIDDSNTVKQITDPINGGCTTTNSRYRTYTKYDASTNRAYTTKVLWDGLTGGQNNVVVVYRAYVSFLAPAYKDEYVA